MKKPIRINKNGMLNFQSATERKFSRDFESLPNKNVNYMKIIFNFQSLNDNKNN